MLAPGSVLAQSQRFLLFLTPNPTFLGLPIPSSWSPGVSPHHLLSFPAKAKAQPKLGGTGPSPTGVQGGQTGPSSTLGSSGTRPGQAELAPTGKCPAMAPSQGLSSRLCPQCLAFPPALVSPTCLGAAIPKSPAQPGGQPGLEGVGTPVSPQPHKANPNQAFALLLQPIQAGGVQCGEAGGIGGPPISGQGGGGCVGGGMDVHRVKRSEPPVADQVELMRQ
ncbi:translation initiation factor IF-2-like [Pipra filicauda]|uniref:Translation initiation factor IF-2-like n=1 Tax=Pipra filicauda TaxID=649802 RepID=A0A7R5K4L0_9PASS|nr:translation initiation factor IF-2-like [Pipra filicauda]